LAAAPPESSCMSCYCMLVVLYYFRQSSLPHILDQPHRQYRYDQL
jgi:hypothetical protein